MTLHVVAIEAVGRSARARRLLFDDGTQRITSNSVVRRLGLEEGSEISDCTPLSEYLEETERSCARERALRALAQRDYSVADLRQRLADDGYPASIAAETVQSFVRSGLVDDERFAEAWARSRARQGFGRRRIADELARKGIDDELAHASLDAATDDDEVARARSLLRGQTPKDRKERERALRRLVSRGFDLPVALRALDGETPAQEDSETFSDAP